MKNKRTQSIFILIIVLFSLICKFPESYIIKLENNPDQINEFPNSQTDIETIVVEYSPNILDVIRFENLTYSFYYLDELNPTSYITGSSIIFKKWNEYETSTLYWEWSYKYIVAGLYEISINTSTPSIDAQPSLDLTFEISKASYETQSFTFEVSTNPSPSEIILNSSTDIIWRNSESNIEIEFDMIDTYFDTPISGLHDYEFKVYYASNLSDLEYMDECYTTYNLLNGRYLTNISLHGFESGLYSFILKMEQLSYLTNYISSETEINVYIEGNNISIDEFTIQDMNSKDLQIDNSKYIHYINNSQLIISFIVMDIDFNTQVEESIGYSFNYWISVNNSDEIDTSSIIYNTFSDKNIGAISVNELEIGEYNITLTVGMRNYENASKSFILKVLDERILKIELYTPIEFLPQNESTLLEFKVSYFDYDNVWKILPNELINFRTNDSEIIILSERTSINGYVLCNVSIPSTNSSDIILSVEYDGLLYGMDYKKSDFLINIEYIPINDTDGDINDTDDDLTPPQDYTDIIIIVISIIVGSVGIGIGIWYIYKKWKTSKTENGEKWKKFKFIKI